MSKSDLFNDQFKLFVKCESCNNKIIEIKKLQKQIIDHIENEHSIINVDISNPKPQLKTEGVHPA